MNEPLYLVLHPNQIKLHTLERLIKEYPGVRLYESRPVGEAPILRHDPYAVPRS